MTELRRRAYLEALGIDVWLSRSGADAEGARLVLGPGEGRVLLIGDSPTACEGEFASDIARALGGDAVWAWPLPRGEAGGECLDEAVRQYLFTQLVVFGETVAAQLFREEPPEVLLSSAVKVCAELDSLALDGAAKRALWQVLRNHVAAGGRPNNA